MFRRSWVWLAPTIDDVYAAFKVMGVPAGAPQDAVRSRYLELARRHHPDLSSGDDTTMKVINTAYELIQTHGSMARATTGASASSPTAPAASSHQPFKKRVPRRARILSDLGDGDSWATKTDLDWNVAMKDIPEKDLLNPANHPYSVSKHYTFEDDATIYRMIRTGATPREVGRTLGKPSTFIEKRLNNAQFKQRIQILLRKEKESRPLKQQVDVGKQTTVPHGARKHWGDMSSEEKSAFMESGGGGVDSHHHHAGGGTSLWGSRNVLSKLGKNYVHFERFHRRGGRGTDDVGGRRGHSRWA